MERALQREGWRRRVERHVNEYRRELKIPIVPGREPDLSLHRAYEEAQSLLETSPPEVAERLLRYLALIIAIRLANYWSTESTRKEVVGRLNQELDQLYDDLKKSGIVSEAQVGEFGRGIVKLVPRP